uniref:Uncharacterized protein n=1 Tax=Lepeophtheirus salmonis TaxID=72036 RepID=A0A0K2TCQ0_LEPSM
MHTLTKNMCLHISKYLSHNDLLTFKMNNVLTLPPWWCKILR